jgi:hypothetical protein
LESKDPSKDKNIHVAYEPKHNPNKRQFAKKKLARRSTSKFCSKDENITHLFFDCSLARYVWSLTA